MVLLTQNTHKQILIEFKECCTMYRACLFNSKIILLAFKKYFAIFTVSTEDFCMAHQGLSNATLQNKVETVAYFTFALQHRLLTVLNPNQGRLVSYSRVCKSVHGECNAFSFLLIIKIILSILSAFKVKIRGHTLHD